jgi:hypothetical protein
VVAADVAAEQVLTGQSELAPTGEGSVERERFIERERTGLATHPGSAVQAFGEGALTTALPIIGDAIVEAIEENLSGDPSLVATRAEHHNIASTLGQATALLGTGLGGVAKSGIARAAAGPLGLVAKGTAKAGAKVATKTGSKVVGTVAEGAIDGVAFGGIQALNNQLLHDKPFSAEAVVAEMGSGALYGGLLGGALGLVGAGAARLANRASGAPGRLAPSGKYTAFREYTKDIVRVTRESKQLETRIIGRIGKSGDGVAERMSKLGSSDLKALDADMAEYVAKTQELADLAGVEFQAPDLATKFTETMQRHGMALKGTNPAADIAAIAELTGVSDFSDDIKELPGGKFMSPLVQLWALGRVGKLATGAKGASGEGLLGLLKKQGAGTVAKNLATRPDKALGNLVRGMAGAVGNTRNAIAKGANAFVKGAAKGRKGAVPSAVAVLERIRFDPDIGKRPERVRKGPNRVFHERSAELEAAMIDPVKTADQIRNKLAAVSHIDPMLGDFALQKSLQKLAFLHGKMPRDPNMGIGLSRVSRWEPSDGQVHKFARYVAAAENPTKVLDELAAGRLNAETVETVKQLYPEMYAQMQQAIIERLAEPGAVEALEYDRRVQMKIFFGVPTDPTLTDDFYKTVQQQWLARDEEAQQGNDQYSTPANVAKAPGVTEAPTMAQRIEGRIE